MDIFKTAEVSVNGNKRIKQKNWLKPYSRLAKFTFDIEANVELENTQFLSANFVELTINCSGEIYVKASAP